MNFYSRYGRATVVLLFSCAAFTYSTLLVTVTTPYKRDHHDSRAAQCRLILSLSLANMSARDREADRIASAQQTLDGMQRSHLRRFRIYIVNLFKVLFDMSQLLGTQLDKETLATCIGMIESGVNPEALAVSVCSFY